MIGNKKLTDISIGSDNVGSPKLNKLVPSATHLNPSISVGHSSVAKPVVIDLDDIVINNDLELRGDHLFDANVIIESVFNNNLVKLDGKLHYFNGRECINISDDVVRRHIANALGKGREKVTQSRIQGTYSVLKDQISNQGIANPPYLKVFFADYVFNLDTMEIEQHCVENRNTRSLPVNYSAEYKCPKFLSWLGTVFSDDLDNLEYIQELIGWTLCRNNLGIEKAIMLLGPQRAGKGILLRIIRELHGAGASSFRLGDLHDDRALSTMRGSHIAIDSDTVAPKKFDATSVMGLFKVITSNESVSNKRLYIQELQEGPLNCKLCVAANSVPMLLDDSQATANRWLPVIFTKSFLDKEDTNLFKKLNTELADIANWALIGLRRLKKRGKFKLPQASTEQLELMSSEGGNLNTFITDALEINENYRCTEKDVWDKYVRWATKGGYELGKRPITIRAVEDALRQHGVRRQKSIVVNGVPNQRGFYGLSTKAENPNNISPLNLPKTG